MPAGLLDDELQHPHCRDTSCNTHTFYYNWFHGDQPRQISLVTHDPTNIDPRGISNQLRFVLGFLHNWALFSAGIRNLYSYATSSGDIRYDNQNYAAFVQWKSRVRGQTSADSMSIEERVQETQSHKFTHLHQNHETWLISWPHSFISDGHVTTLLHILKNFNPCCIQRVQVPCP